MRPDNSIFSKVDMTFCTGCGTCESFCPVHTIELVVDSSKGIYLPKLVDPQRCINCGLCVSVCPAFSLDFAKLSTNFVGNAPSNLCLGKHIACFSGNSTNHNVRYNSSSGGLVTSLLLFALNQEIIDGALVTCIDENNPLRPSSFVATSEDEILSSVKSKYCPIPINKSLRKIIESKGRFAVVGLPCHIHGIRKAELVDKSLRDKIVLHLGLFCSHNVTFDGTTYFLRKFGVNEKDVSKFYYRFGGWPGFSHIELKNGKSLSDKKEQWNNQFRCRYFTPEYCMFCRDSTNEFSDISFGDPWLPKFKNENVGKSLIICRTDKALNFLKNAQADGKIVLEGISDGDVEKSQQSIRYKKRIVNAVYHIDHVFNKRTKSPMINFETISPTVTDYLIASLFIFNLKLSLKQSLWPTLDQWGTLVNLFKTKFHI